MGFYDEMKNTYGEVTVRDLKSWANLNTRLAKARCRRNFLLRCRSTGVIPRHIKQNIKCINNLIGDNAGDNRRALALSNKVSSTLLNLEISVTIKKINSLHAGIKHIRERLILVLPIRVISIFEQTQSRSSDRITVFSTNVLKRKFDSLIDKSISDLKVKDSWFANLTDHVFPRDIKHLLSLGPRFAHSVPSNILSIKSLLADSEYLVRLAPQESQDLLRAKSTNAITNFIHQAWRKNNPQYGLFCKTKRFLKDNDDIVITMADKGNVTVAITKQQYEEKLLNIVEDTNVYKKLNSDPTSRYQTKNNSLVKDLKDQAYISATTARQLNNYKGISPTIYGLPKIHKEGTPLRPIVSTIKSPTSELSKFVADILKSAFKDDFHTWAVKDSFDFAEKVNNLQIPPDHEILSLDVISLFTNISWELTEKIIVDNWSRIEAVTNIPRPKFVNLLKFLFDSNYFKYKGEFYSQIFGCPMGSILSPTLAALVMTVLIGYCLSKLSFIPAFLFQYVDDIILAIPSNMKEELLRIFNSFNPHIQFTIEEEKDRFVPFLDTKVIRSEDNTVKLDWYRKPTSSGRYVHFNSSHDWQMKINVVNNLKNRIIGLTHMDFKQSALNRLYDILKDNGYPHGLLKKLIFSTSNRRISPDPPEHPPTTLPQQRQDAPHESSHVSQIKFASLPSLPGLTSKLVHIFSSISNVKIARYNVFPNKFLFTNLKDRADVLSSSDCVYSVRCLDCEGVYIGQTSQSLKRRFAVHKSDVRLHPDRCALALHAARAGHVFDFDNPKILYSCSNNTKRVFFGNVLY
ncbi:uncharacterized protein LOC123311365 [Coccinella septempunctata]|uniref:uncharacterized protein LOC123311365 n=1 Tax=Coccinella septempunctata TaxID=41139 RepID=UPI001D080CD8|nr:uncharacterized protein LOC123311365 [Coccinella septempunctata]